MRFVSWNVNGLRAVLKKGFENIVQEFDADVFAVQETKLQVGQAAPELSGYYEFWSYAQRKGYSGTAVFSKRVPLQVLHGLGVPHLDTEGRICALEFPELWFVCVYTPNAQPELARIDHRMEWDDAFRDFCIGLEAGVLPEGVPVQRLGGANGANDAAEGSGSQAGVPFGGGHVDVDTLPLTRAGETACPKPVVMCGDFNVAHEEIDLKNPGPNRGNAGFSDEERDKFSRLVNAGFIDTFRLVHGQEEGAYTWWSYRSNARKNNTGWRIDYFLVSEQLRDAVRAASIYPEVFGSDHCPVALELALEE